MNQCQLELKIQHFLVLLHKRHKYETSSCNYTPPNNAHSLSEASHDPVIQWLFLRHTKHTYHFRIEVNHINYEELCSHCIHLEGQINTRAHPARIANLPPRRLIRSPEDQNTALGGARLHYGSQLLVGRRRRWNESSGRQASWLQYLGYYSQCFSYQLRYSITWPARNLRCSNPSGDTRPERERQIDSFRRKFQQTAAKSGAIL